jgi:hypothetical protein
MMHQTQIVLGVFMCLRLREDLEIWVGKISSLLPVLDAALGAWSQDYGSMIRT